MKTASLLSPRSRTRRSPEEIARLLSEYQVSGLTQGLSFLFRKPRGSPPSEPHAPHSSLNRARARVSRFFSCHRRRGRNTMRLWNREFTGWNAERVTRRRRGTREAGLGARKQWNGQWPGNTIPNRIFRNNLIQ